MAVLICIIHDERVEWYEALILVLLYIVYIAVMYFDKTIQKWARGNRVIVVDHDFVDSYIYTAAVALFMLLVSSIFGFVF